jgi:hypothetical protein
MTTTGRTSWFRKIAGLFSQTPTPAKETPLDRLLAITQTYPRVMFHLRSMESLPPKVLTAVIEQAEVANWQIWTPTNGCFDVAGANDLVCQRVQQGEGLNLEADAIIIISREEIRRLNSGSREKIVGRGESKSFLVRAVDEKIELILVESVSPLNHFPPPPITKVEAPYDATPVDRADASNRPSRPALTPSIPPGGPALPLQAFPLEFKQIDLGEGRGRLLDYAVKLIAREKPMSRDRRQAKYEDEIRQAAYQEKSSQSGIALLTPALKAYAFALDEQQTRTALEYVFVALGRMPRSSGREVINRIILP